MAAIVTNRARQLWARGEITWKAATTAYYGILVYTSNTFDADVNFVADAGYTLGEVSGTNYTAGYASAGAPAAAARQRLVLYDATEDDTGDKSVLRANRCTWTAINVGATAVAKLVVYAHSGTYNAVAVTGDANAPVIAIIDMSSPSTIVTNGGDFTFKFANDDGTKGDVVQFT